MNYTDVRFVVFGICSKVSEAIGVSLVNYCSSLIKVAIIKDLNANLQK